MIDQTQIPPTPSTAAVEIVLQVGAEGGSIVLLRKDGSPEAFCVRILDQSLSLVDEGEDITRQGTWDSWQTALQSLDYYPWRRLVPLNVHPDYRETIWDLVSANSRDLPEHRIRDWAEACGR